MTYNASVIDSIEKKTLDSADWGNLVSGALPQWLVHEDCAKSRNKTVISSIKLIPLIIQKTLLKTWGFSWSKFLANNFRKSTRMRKTEIILS